jgi:hypothetical protein
LDSQTLGIETKHFSLENGHSMSLLTATGISMLVRVLSVMVKLYGFGLPKLMGLPE